MLLTGCEAPLNLDAVERQHSEALQRTDFYQAMASNGETTLIVGNDGVEYDIFGRGGARKRAEELQVPFLGEVPINMQIRIRGDEGNVAATLDDPATAPALEQISYNLVNNLAKERAAKPPMPSLPVL